MCHSVPDEDNLDPQITRNPNKEPMISRIEEVRNVIIFFLESNIDLIFSSPFLRCIETTFIAKK